MAIGDLDEDSGGRLEFFLQRFESPHRETCWGLFVSWVWTKAELSSLNLSLRVTYYV